MGVLDELVGSMGPAVPLSLMVPPPVILPVRENGNVAVLEKFFSSISTCSSTTGLLCGPLRLTVKRPLVTLTSFTDRSSGAFAVEFGGAPCADAPMLEKFQTPGAVSIRTISG